MVLQLMTSLLIVYLLLSLAYFLGIREGKRRANQSAVKDGAWVEFNKPTKTLMTNFKSVTKKDEFYTINQGTQGIVFGTIPGKTYSVWVAEPWASDKGTQQWYSDISNFTAIKVGSIFEISDDMLKQTLKSLQDDIYMANKVFGQSAYSSIIEILQIIDRNKRDNLNKSLGVDDSYWYDE